MLHGRSTPVLPGFDLQHTTPASRRSSTRDGVSTQGVFDMDTDGNLSPVP